MNEIKYYCQQMYIIKTWITTDVQWLGSHLFPLNKSTKTISKSFKNRYRILIKTVLHFHQFRYHVKYFHVKSIFWLKAHFRTNLFFFLQQILKFPKSSVCIKINFPNYKLLTNHYITRDYHSSNCFGIYMCVCVCYF